MNKVRDTLKQTNELQNEDKEQNMDILIPVVIVTVVVLFSIRKFKPILWLRIKSKFKK